MIYIFGNQQIQGKRDKIVQKIALTQRGSYWQDVSSIKMITGDRENWVPGHA